MEYLLLIYTNEADEPGPSTPEQATLWAQYEAYSEEAGRRGILVEARALHPSSSATTIRLRNGETLAADGPHTTAEEQLGGYYIIDVEDLDAAIEAAIALPAARYGAVEVRPVRDPSRAPA